MIRYIKTEDLNLYYKLARELSDFVDNFNITPTEALKKIAESYNLSENQISLLARTFNVSKTLQHFSNEYGNKNQYFALADPNKVIEELYHLSKIKKASYEPTTKNKVLPPKINLLMEQDGKTPFISKFADYKRKEEKEKKDIEYWMKPTWATKDNKQPLLKKLDLLKFAMDKLEQYALGICNDLYDTTDKLISWTKQYPYYKDQLIQECQLRFGPIVSTFVNHYLKPIYKSAQYYNKDLLFEEDKAPYLYLVRLSSSFEKLEKVASLLDQFVNVKRVLEASLEKKNAYEDLANQIKTQKVRVSIIPKRYSNVLLSEDDEKEEGGGSAELSVSPSEYLEAERELSKQKVVENTEKLLNTISRLHEDLDLKVMLDEWIMNDRFSGFKPADVYNAAVAIINTVPQLRSKPLLLRSAILQYLNNGEMLTVSEFRDLIWAVNADSKTKDQDATKTQV